MTDHPDGPLGVVIPTLNEGDALDRLLERLAAMDVPTRAVVADGGSRDHTRAVARAHGVHLVVSPRGRGTQMNAGARALPGAPWLLFLHADTLPEQGVERSLRAWLRDATPRDAGAFSFRLSGERRAWRILEMGQRTRQRLTGLPYGDQGLLVSRDAFRAVGGYPEIPIMEDVAIARRLRAHGVRIARLKGDLLTSPRRYEREGLVRAVTRNGILLGLYAVGVPPGRLARWYAPEPGAARGAPARELTDGNAAAPEDPPAPPEPMPHLLVFVKEPRPGRVKTRLAEAVGAGEAAALYRAMGRAVVHRLRGGPYHTEVHFTPAAAREPVEEWLESRDLAFVPQVEGDLGRRLDAAFRGVFQRGAPAAAVVGTDTPGLTRERVKEAFRSLRDAEVVLGPAVDGGYYLLALAAPHGELFHDVPWSTEGVLEATLERARIHGLAVALLPELQDVDRPEDLEALARHPDLPHPRRQPPEDAPPTPVAEGRP